ncbi:uncharacterized protein LOC115211934 [Argonauta hians]
MGRSTKEETKTEERKLSDQQFDDEERSKSLETNNTNINSETDELVRNFSGFSISKCEMKTVELDPSGDDSESEEEEGDKSDCCEKTKRGPINGIPVSHICNQNDNFTFQDQFNQNKSKRTLDSGINQHYKYKKPGQGYDLNENWLNNSFPSMNGGTVSIKTNNYECKNKTIPYPFLEHLKPSTQDDQEDTLNDLMAIVNEDTRGMCSSPSNEDLLSHFNESEIKIIKDTLKKISDENCCNTSENPCLEYSDEKNMVSPPPQCVPQLSDALYLPEIPDSPNVNGSESEYNRHVTESYGLMSASQNTSYISSVNDIGQDQVNFNNYIGTSDGSGITNASLYMKKPFSNGNFQMIDTNQINPVFQDFNFHNSEQILMSPNSGQQPIIIGNSPQTIMDSPNAAQTMNTGNHGHFLSNKDIASPLIINARTSSQTIVNVGSPKQTTVNSGSPGKVITNAGSPGRVIMSAGSPGHIIMNVGSPGHIITNVGSPGKVITNVGSPGKVITNVGSPGRVNTNVGSPGRVIMSAGSPGKVITSAGSPGQTIIDGGSPYQSFSNVGSPCESIANTGSPFQAVPNVLSPCQDSSSQTLLNEDEQEQIIRNATSQHQTSSDETGWINSIAEGHTQTSVSLNTNNSSLTYSPTSEFIRQTGRVYSPSQPVINGTLSNIQSPTIVAQQMSCPTTNQSTPVSSTPVLVLKSPPVYYMSPTSNALILVQNPPKTTKSTPKPILPKPPASDMKCDFTNITKRGKPTDTNLNKPGTSHQLIARRCVASISDEQLLAVDLNGNNYLHAAVCATDVNMVKALIERIKRMNKIEIINDCNNINQTPLYLAVSNNKPAIVCELVRNGANPNILAEIKVSESEKRRRSALHCAATQGKEFSLVLKQLFESKKIDPNIKNCEGLTPLLNAIKDHGRIVTKNNKSIVIDNCINVSILLKNGADPEIYDDRNGTTPLMCAIDSKDINLIEAIVKHVDAAKLKKMLSAKSFDGRTCWLIAEESQNKYEPAMYRKLTSILSLNK